MRVPSRIRKGITAIETALLFALAGAGTIATVHFLGRTTNQELEQTAADVANPSSLVQRWAKDKPVDSVADTGSKKKGGRGKRRRKRHGHHRRDD